MTEIKKSLWGENFDLSSTLQKNALNKLKNLQDGDVKKLTKSKKLSIEERLSLIKDNVLKVLGQHQKDTLVIRDKESLIKYIDKSIENGIISIDTETDNSLDPITCKLMGPCIYTPGLKQAYIPLNHVNYKANIRLKDQLNEEDIKNQFDRLIKSNIKILMHNGKFDYKVIKCTCGIELPIYWDTMIAARMLDENESSAGLKQQYIDKIDPNQEKYSIDHLFENILYEQVDPEIFALYAATDAQMTYKLYQWQVERFKDPDLQGVFWVFKNIEMPLIKVVAEMELTGVEVDQEYAKRLSIKYHKLLDECNAEIQNELSRFSSIIRDWKLTPEANFKPKKKANDPDDAERAKSKNEQLENPINIESPKQLAILLYDILKLPQVNKEKPRGTGVDELTTLVNKTDSKLCSLILKQRGLNKLINTFIDKLPNDVNPKTGKIHCQFNATGTDTGRFSSSNPNLQQIPRSNIEIKPIFKAPKGYSFVLCDLSAAEVRTSANASKDPDMLNAYREGKDLYSLIASKIYNNKYEDNLEFYPEGTKVMFEGKEIICGHKTTINKLGKTRRQDSKSVLIGLIYGRGSSSIATQINETRAKKGGDPITREDAQNLINSIYKSFPRLKEWMDETHDFLHKNGYIDDCFGRRRRLPDGMLPQYSFELSPEAQEINFNPILNCNNKVNDNLIKKYQDKLSNIKYYRDYDSIKNEALKEGIIIHDNKGYIAQAERQSVNFQAQAASSDINKLSMIAIDNNKRLKELGFQLLMTIHDEVIGQCPSENAEEVAQIIPDIMTHIGGDKMVCPLVADSTIERHWYETDVIAALNAEYDKLIKDKGLSQEEAIENIVKSHTELLPEQIYGCLKEGKDYLWN